MLSDEVDDTSCRVSMLSREYAHTDLHPSTLWHHHTIAITMPFFNVAGTRLALIISSAYLLIHQLAVCTTSTSNDMPTHTRLRYARLAMRTKDGQSLHNKETHVAKKVILITRLLSLKNFLYKICDFCLQLA